MPIDALSSIIRQYVASSAQEHPDFPRNQALFPLDQEQNAEPSNVSFTTSSGIQQELDLVASSSDSENEKTSTSTMDFHDLKTTFQGEIRHMETRLNDLGSDWENSKLCQCHPHDFEHIKGAIVAIYGLLKSVSDAQLCVEYFIAAMYECHRRVLCLLPKQDLISPPTYIAEPPIDSSLGVLNCFKKRIHRINRLCLLQTRLLNRRREISQSIAASLETSYKFAELYSAEGFEAIETLEELCDYIRYLASDLGEEISRGTRAEYRLWQKRYTIAKTKMKVVLHGKVFIALPEYTNPEATTTSEANTEPEAEGVVVGGDTNTPPPTPPAYSKSKRKSGVVRKFGRVTDFFKRLLP